jgi:hypothetical protein
MCDYQDEAHLEDDDALSAGYRAEAAVFAQMLRDLGLRFWWRDGSGFWRAMTLSPVAEPRRPQCADHRATVRPGDHGGRQ